MKQLLPKRFPVLSRGILSIVLLTSSHHAIAQIEIPASDNPKTVAGRTLEQWSAESHSPNLIRRLRAVKTLPTFDERSIPALTEALSDSHPAARYWAANGLGDIGSKKSSQKAIPILEKMLESKNRADRMCAAYALCRLGKVKTALVHLTEALTDPEKGTATSAADFIARIGPPAKAAIPALEKAQKHKDYHVRRSAKEAIRRINGISPVNEN